MQVYTLIRVATVAVKSVKRIFLKKKNWAVEAVKAVLFRSLGYKSCEKYITVDLIMFKKSE